MTTSTNRVKILEGLRRRNRLKARRKASRARRPFTPVLCVPGLAYCDGVLRNTTAAPVQATLLVWGYYDPDYEPWAVYHVDMAPGEDHDIAEYFTLLTALPGHQDPERLIRQCGEVARRGR